MLVMLCKANIPWLQEQCRPNASPTAQSPAILSVRHISRFLCHHASCTAMGMEKNTAYNSQLHSVYNPQPRAIRIDDYMPKDAAKSQILIYNLNKKLHCRESTVIMALYWQRLTGWGMGGGGRCRGFSFHLSCIRAKWKLSYLIPYLKGGQDHTREMAISQRM